MTAGTVLVTGATGFIGRSLCEVLRHRHWRVVGLSSRPAAGPWDSHIAVDLKAAVPPASSLRGVECIVHCAGIAHQRAAPLDYRRVNLEATRELAATAIQAGVPRFVFLSSLQAYLQAVGVLDEPYACSKLAAEAELLALAAEGNIQLTTLRPALVYGTGVKGNLRRLIAGTAAGWLPPLPATPGGVAMVAREDLLTAVLAVLEAGAGLPGTWLVHDGDFYSPARIQRAVWRAQGRRGPRWTLPRGALGLAARLGDFATSLGMAAPLDSAVLAKLFADHSRLVPGEAASLDATGWQPAHRLEAAMAGMLQAL